MTTTAIAALRARYYPTYDRLAFLRVVEQRARPEDRVLDVGCSDGRHAPALKGKVRLYAGVDPDPRALGNPHLDEVRLGTAEDLPWPDGSFDLVFHRMLAEHLRDPISATRDMARVLAPGGRLMFETPNRWYYAALASALTPHWVHERLVSRPNENIYPTFYRCNSRRQIRRALSAAGLRGDMSFVGTPPQYLTFHPAAYLLGTAWERSVERLFPALRAKIIVEAHKPALIKRT